MRITEFERIKEELGKTAWQRAIRKDRVRKKRRKMQKESRRRNRGQ